MTDYVVVKSEVNKFGFGNVMVVGGENLHAKGKYGFGTGQKGMPPCVSGDSITADIGSNNKGYPEIKNITVTGKAPANAMPAMSGAKKGTEFRTPAQIMRTSALEFALTNNNEPVPVDELLMLADDFYMYIEKGGSTVATDPILDDDIPF